MQLDIKMFRHLQPRGLNMSVDTVETLHATPGCQMVTTLWAKSRRQAATAEFGLDILSIRSRAKVLYSGTALL